MRAWLGWSAPRRYAFWWRRARGLKRHPALLDEALAKAEPEKAPNAGLLDDEFDPNDARRMDQLARNAAVVRRAHAMDQAGDDLIPSF